ncbi:hypothetical protein ZWY2020_014402 [Hordeum vulgare]|nr:hypothetical protein ZWY2020_014402 [Hordeum vulgare]
MLQLLEKGYAITAVDNFHISVPEALDRVHHIVGPTLSTRLIRVDDLEKVLAAKRYDAVIHFAGLKAVAESVAAEHLRQFRFCDFDGTFHNDSVLDTPIGTCITGGKDHAVCGFNAGAYGFEEATQLINHYFEEGGVGVRFDQSIRCPLFSETQSQSVDGMEEVTLEWMVPDQLREYELKQHRKMLRFECDSNEYVEKEKQRRHADGAKFAKFAKFKKRLSSIAEEGCTHWQSPRVACRKKNLGKRAAEASSGDPQENRSHVSEAPTLAMMTLCLVIL